MKRGIAIGLLVAACSPARSEPPAATVVESRADPAPEVADPGAVPQRTPVERVWKPSELLRAGDLLGEQVTVRGYFGVCTPLRRIEKPECVKCCLVGQQIMVLTDGPNDPPQLDCSDIESEPYLALHRAFECSGGCSFKCSPPVGALVEVSGRYDYLQGPGTLKVLMSSPEQSECIDECE